MNLLEKAKVMLAWMKLSEEMFRNVISGSHILNIDDIKEIDLPDSFMDDDVDISILCHFMKKDCFERITELIQKKKHRNIFICGECLKAVEDNCILCDRCLLWHHYLCVDIDVSANASLLNKDWYCPKCV